MARRFYIKDRSAPLDPHLELTVAFWVDIPAGRVAEFANPAATTAVEDATAGELADIRAGRVVERVVTLRWSQDLATDDVIARLKAYYAQLRREVLGQNQQRNVFFKRGQSYDPAADAWTG
jgi:hypothetical protein